MNFFEGIGTLVADTAQNIVNFFQKAFEKVVDLIPDPLKELLGGVELPQIDLDIKFPKFENPFKGLKDKLIEIKDVTIEYFELEQLLTEENNKQLDAKNKIVETNLQLKKDLDEIKKKEEQAREEAKKLQETFEKIGESVRNDLVNNLTDAITEGKSFGDAMINVLVNLKKRLVNLALDRAISGIGKSLSGGKGFTGFLGGLFNKRERGGPVSAGGAFLVGERGPEILQMGSKGGNIIPNSPLGSGGGGTTNVVTVNVDASGSSVSGNNADASQLGQVIGQAVQAQLIKEKRAGGLLTR